MRGFAIWISRASRQDRPASTFIVGQAGALIGKQIDAFFEDIEVDAVKVGMLSAPECMDEVAAKLKYYHPANIVIDPVMYAKNGCPLMEPAAIKTLIGTAILPC